MKMPSELLNMLFDDEFMGAFMEKAKPTSA
jgi:hypothetical protein